MDLTSLRRVKFALGIAKTDQDAILSRSIAAASKSILKELRRLDQGGLDGIQLRERTEYFDPTPDQVHFYPKAYPIASVTSLYVDGTGYYTGSQQAIESTSYVISGDGRLLAINQIPTLPRGWPGLPTVEKGLRLVYTAGLSEDAVISEWTKAADVGGTLTVGNYIQGEDSGSVGILTARAAGTLAYECLSGNFLEGETVTEYEDWIIAQQDSKSQGATGVSAVLTACTSRSLAEAHTDLVEACEMQVRFLKTNRNNFENLTVTQDGATRVSRADLKNKYGLMPEICFMIEAYYNRLVP